MPSLLSDTVAANYNQVGNVNGLGPQTRIFQADKTNMTTAEVNTLVKKLMQGGTSGTNDAVTVAGLGTADGSAFSSGVTDTIFVAVQGTGVITAASPWAGTGFNLTLISVFKDVDA